MHNPIDPDLEDLFREIWEPSPEDAVRLLGDERFEVPVDMKPDESDLEDLLPVWKLPDPRSLDDEGSDFPVDLFEFKSFQTKSAADSVLPSVSEARDLHYRLGLGDDAPSPGAPQDDGCELCADWFSAHSHTDWLI
ncbi:hypothetical protein EV132_1672 [Rhizobium sullae]|uniref:Uncharacterized protein n=1 Tax=Rhizobium sullae TaxID=50338 RepID=A0A4V2V7R2_RHISU|nr:hypothetical protein EV132_1672 [Rhizobium sullae]